MWLTNGWWLESPPHVPGRKRVLCEQRGERLGRLNLMRFGQSKQPGYCKSSSSLKAMVVKTRKALIVGGKKRICMCLCSKINSSPCRHTTQLTALCTAPWEPRGWQTPWSPMPVLCTNFPKVVGFTVRTLFSSCICITQDANTIWCVCARRAKQYIGYSA